jgi:hypothetical protein
MPHSAQKRADERLISKERSSKTESSEKMLKY